MNKQDNTIDLVEINEHIERLKGFLIKFNNLPADAKEQLTAEIKFWEEKIK